MESRLKERNIRRKRRSMRVRKGVRGISSKPRLTVFRSNKHLFAQIIDDETRVTLFGIGTMSNELKGTPFAKKSKESAREIGKRIASHAKENKIDRIVFDRSSYKYHGLIAELADAAREQGLLF